jgi:hypothetical protein
MGYNCLFMDIGVTVIRSDDSVAFKGVLEGQLYLIDFNDSVPCTREDRPQTLHLRVSRGALRYNSLDCPVRHRTVRCTKRSNGYQRNGRLHSALTEL